MEERRFLYSSSLRTSLVWHISGLACRNLIFFLLKTASQDVNLFYLVKNLADMELSVDKETVFFGGNAATTNSNKPASAVITACRFNNDLTVVDIYELKEQNPTVAFCLKQSTRENILFAGCMKSLHVLEWKKNKLQLLMIAVDIHTSRFL